MLLALQLDAAPSTGFPTYNGWHAGDGSALTNLTGAQVTGQLTNPINTTGSVVASNFNGLLPSTNLNINLFQVTATSTNQLAFTGFTTQQGHDITSLNGFWTIQTNAGQNPWYKNGTNGYYQVTNTFFAGSVGDWAVTNGTHTNEATPDMILILDNSGSLPIVVVGGAMLDGAAAQFITGNIQYPTNTLTGPTGTVDSEFNLFATNLDIVGTLKNIRLSSTAGQVIRSAAPMASFYQASGVGLIRSIQWIGDNGTGRGASGCTNVHLRGYFNKGNIFTNQNLGAGLNKLPPSAGTPDFDVALSYLFSSTLATNDVFKNSRYIQSGSVSNTLGTQTSWGLLTFPMPFTNGALICAWDYTNNAIYTNGGWSVVDWETTVNSLGGTGNGGVFPFSYLKFHGLTVTNVFQTNGAGAATNFAYISITNGPGEIVGMNGVWFGNTNAPNYLESWWQYASEFTGTNSTTGIATGAGITGALAAGGEDLPLNEFFFATGGTRAVFLDAGTTFYQGNAGTTQTLLAEWYRYWPESVAPQWRKNFQVEFSNGIFTWAGPVTNVVTFFWYGP